MVALAAVVAQILMLEVLETRHLEVRHKVLMAAAQHKTLAVAVVVRQQSVQPQL